MTVADRRRRLRTLLNTDEADDAALRGFLEGLPRVDEAALETRGNAVSARTPDDPGPAELDALIRVLDLTTLEGTDTPDRVRRLVARAVRPDPDDPGCPSTAAVCVYGDLVPAAVAARDAAGGRLAVASVAGAFPSGRASLAVKVLEVREAVAAGADELDVVIDRGAFLDERFAEVFAQLSAMRAACDERDGAPARLKVILETGELGAPDAVRRACWLALLAGADFLKTSTGKTAPAATLPAALLLFDAVRGWRDATGARVGVKPAGGIRDAATALSYLTAARTVAGAEWGGPELFRLGASSLLDDLVRRRRAHGGPT